MAEDYYAQSRGILNDVITQNQAAAQEKPSGIFSNVDPVMLGLAQGFLSPTKTGGFGESMGLGLAGAQAPLEALRKRQMDAQEKIMNARLAIAKLDMEAPYYQARADYYGVGGPRSGASGDRENRLIYTTLLNDANKLMWDDDRPPINPITMQPFTSEDELEQFKSMIRSKLYRSGVGLGADEGAPAEDSGPIPKISDDAKGRSRYNSLAPGSQYIAPDGTVRTKPAGTGERG